MPVGKMFGNFVLEVPIFLLLFIPQFYFYREIVEEVTRIGKILVKVDPTETVVGNMVKRILKLIRDEYNHCKGIAEEPHEVEETLQKIMSTTTNNLSEFDVDVKVDDFKDSFFSAIQEELSELEASGVNIATQALEHIYSDEVI